MQASGTATSTPKQLSIDDLPVQSNSETTTDNIATSSSHNYFGSAINTVNYDVEE
jgi:hypothetical protein